MLIDSQTSFLMVVDVQEKLTPKIQDMQKLMSNIIRLIKSARVLQIPILCSEHCPDKIGATSTKLMDHISADSIVTKTHFSACLEPEIADRMSRLNRKQAIIVGAETHVCVLQTTLMLKQNGYQPYLVADATSSRQSANKQLAITRMMRHDIDIVGTEMVIFEWLCRADTQEFQELLPLIRDY